jgi:hypothetical protein
MRSQSPLQPLDCAWLLLICRLIASLDCLLIASRLHSTHSMRVPRTLQGRLAWSQDGVLVLPGTGSHQSSVINHQPSVISHCHQSSVIVISHQSSRVKTEFWSFPAQEAINHQSSIISHQSSAIVISHQSSSSVISHQGSRRSSGPSRHRTSAEICTSTPMRF